MNRRGFSLIELLVACAILSLLIILLAQMLGSVSNIWMDGSSRSQRRQTTRAVLNFISRELQEASLPADRQVVAGRGDLQLVINPATVPDKFKHPHAIFWAAPIATDDSEGDQAEIGYFIRWTGGRAALCRLFLNPAESRTLLGGTNTLQRIYQHPGNWVNGDVLDAACPADEATGYRGLFADNVIAFWARPLNAAGTPIFNQGSDGFDSNIASGGNAAPALPAGMEISFIVLDSNIANRLADNPEAASLVAEIQALARTSGQPATGIVPSAAFMDAISQRADLRFLLPGATPCQILVDLK